MSVEKRYYVIGGYDLTRYRNDKYEDWMWSDEHEAFINSKIKNDIQIFDDSMSGGYLYLGKVLHRADQYEFNPFSIEPVDICFDLDEVKSKLTELIERGVINEKARFELTCPFKIIVFEECV